MVGLCLNIVFLPLLSFLILSIFGRFLGKKGSSYLSVFLLGLTLFMSIIAFVKVALLQEVLDIKIMYWIDCFNFVVSWGFLFDTLTVVMLIVVSSVSFLVHFYSIGYMSEDPHVSRFMSYLSLFTFFMLMLVTADNFLQLFLGWEGVGLCSFLLINFWYTRIQANKAAVKAVIVNKLGDFGLFLAIILVFYVFGSFDYGVVFSLISFIENQTMFFFFKEFNVLTLISFFIFVGAVGKSAQLGLHTWLPDAMEGPTPVSALIHAATMVTAGVFAVVRTSPIIEMSSAVLLLLTIFGALTCFFAATVGIFQNDIKRVIAYSTCSQLGYMVFACGLSNYNVAMFHLSNHAFFKALLFLSAGAIIHSLNDEQDMRKMGGLVNLMPFTYTMFLVGSLSLMGFPFLTGFYSKDVILEVAGSSFFSSGTFAFWLGTLAATCTAFYSFRLISLVFFTKPNGYRISYSHIHEVSGAMMWPLFILSIGSIFFGYFFKDMFIGLGSDFWGNSIFINPLNCSLSDSEFIPIYIKLLPLIFSFLGASFSILFYMFNSNILLALKLKFKEVYSFFSKKWMFDLVYNGIFVKEFLNISYNFAFKLLDRGWFEFFGPTGLSKFVMNLKDRIVNIQSGFIHHYLFLFIFGLICFITILVIPEIVFSYLSLEFLVVLVVLLFFYLII